ncbi:MAG: hypothetical protein ACKOU6_14790, partial [Planctomycetota bacterium]
MLRRWAIMAGAMLFANRADARLDRGWMETGMTAAAMQAAEVGQPTGEKIVAKDAKLERLYTRELPIKGGLAEGPAVAPDGSIYYTDIPMGDDRGVIMRFDPATRQTAVFTLDSGKANGLIFDQAGFLLAGGGGGGGGGGAVGGGGGGGGGGGRGRGGGRGV